MACDITPAGNLSYLTNFNGTGPFEAVQCQYVLTVGSLTFALFVFGTLALMYYISDDSFIIPTVLAVILGGVVFTELPGGFVQIAALVFVLVGSVSILYIIHRVRQGN